MPDHVHLVPAPRYDANRPVNIRPALCREESIEDKVDYISGNPVGAGLVEDSLEYRWFWRDTGDAAA